MCYFITVALQDDDTGVIADVVPRGFATYPVVNRSVAAALPTGFQTFVLVSGMCSCGLYQRRMPARHKNHDPQRMRRKYAKKGWSPVKIERAIKQSQAAISKQDEFLGFRDDVVEILMAIAAAVPKFAVLVHWYSGLVDGESIEFGAAQETSSDRLGEIVPEEDCLLWVRRTD